MGKISIKNNSFSSAKIFLRDRVGKILKETCYRVNLTNYRLRFPLAACFNVHTYCNESCIMCPRHTAKKIPTPELMPWPMYEKLLDEFSSKGGQILTFNNFSEIFAHSKGIDYVLRALSYKNLQVYLVTNGLNLTETYLDRIMSTGFEGIIYVSCHGFSRDTFKKVTRVDGFSIVKENIAKLAQAHLHPERIVVQLIKDYCSADEIREANNYWQNMGVTVNEMSAHTFCQPGAPADTQSTIKHKLIGCNSWGHDAGLPFHQIVIQADGKVTLCCMDVLNSVVLGDAFGSTIDQIWNGREFGDMLHAIYSGVTPASHSLICNRCPAAVYDDKVRRATTVDIVQLAAANFLSKRI